MINPYRHTPSARPTKISDLPKALGSSLIAPKAALAALATAIPPPTQESPVDNAAASYPSPVAIPASEPACAACTWGVANIITPAITMIPKKKKALNAILRL